MRSVAVGLCLVSLGCATTVSRAPGGEVTLGSGAAQGECESEHWLALAGARYQVPQGERGLGRRSDGVGVYRVGAAHPESIPALEESLGTRLLRDEARETIRVHDRDRFVAIGLGAGAAAALAVGTILLVSSFETKTTRRADGSLDEEQEVVGGRLAAGGIVLGAGFGLGIGSVAVAPSAKQRAEADAARYVFRPDVDDLKRVETSVDAANVRTRGRCGQR
ncbi:MAG: hypothetical protein KF718_17975 [Polyangiaceae bacterium]|nr:hypothetical protein [Polyangiaceae bacterium]